MIPVIDNKCRHFPAWEWTSCTCQATEFFRAPGSAAVPNAVTSLEKEKHKL